LIGSKAALSRSAGATEEEKQDLKSRIEKQEKEKKDAVEESEQARKDLEEKQNEINEMNRDKNRAESAVRDYVGDVDARVDKELQTIFAIGEVFNEMDGHGHHKEVRWREFGQLDNDLISKIVYNKKVEHLDYENPDQGWLINSLSKWQKAIESNVTTPKEPKQPPEEDTKEDKRQRELWKGYMDDTDPDLIPEAVFKTTTDEEATDEEDKRQFSIRWKDEEIHFPPTKIGDREIKRKPRVIHVKFVKRLQERYNKTKAEKILLHLMNAWKECIQNEGTGYSTPKILWFFDTEKKDWAEKKMTPQQKFKFLLNLKAKKENEMEEKIKEKDKRIEKLNKIIEEMKSEKGRKRPHDVIQLD